MKPIVNKHKKKACEIKIGFFLVSYYLLIIFLFRCYLGWKRKSDQGEKYDWYQLQTRL